MDTDVNGKFISIVEFTVRNEKYRGLIIESIATKSDEYFFKYADQPLHRHCDQIQRVVRAAEVKRCKKITVDIAGFEYEYLLDNVVTFHGSKLNSANKQVQKVYDRKLNKEIGEMKRKITMEQNKSKKIQEKNDIITTRMSQAEKRFQAERQRKIHELFGEGSGTEPPKKPPIVARVEPRSMPGSGPSALSLLRSGGPSMEHLISSGAGLSTGLSGPGPSAQSLLQGGGPSMQHLMQNPSGIHQCK